MGVHDGYGQTETGALTGMPIGEPVRPGIHGPRPARLPALDRGGRAVRRPRHRAHLLHRRPRGHLAHRRPREPGRGRLPLVRGPHRRRDHLRRLPDRAVRGGVRAGLPPRRGRGRRRGRARRGARPGGARRGGAARRRRGRRRAGRASCRTTSRKQTAPYKYPRIVEFADVLPKTASGKIRRARAARPAASLGPCPTAWPTRPPPTSSSTRTTRWTGSRGTSEALARAREATCRSCSRSATRPATGAT